MRVTWWEKNHTETGGKDIIFLSTMTGGQVIVQAKLPVTIVAVQRAIILRSCIQNSGIIAATKEMGDTVQGRGRFGRVGIERDDRTIGEAGALAE